MKTPESEAFKQAIEDAGLSQIRLAEALDIPPAVISQWANGIRPIPAHRARPLAEFIGAEPAVISAAYRRILAQEQPEQVEDELLDLRRQVHDLTTALTVLADVMAAHRPLEAAEAAKRLLRLRRPDDEVLANLAKALVP